MCRGVGGLQGNLRFWAVWRSYSSHGFQGIGFSSLHVLGWDFTIEVYVLHMSFESFGVKCPVIVHK